MPTKPLPHSSPEIHRSLIAPCGLNCAVCSAHRRTAEPCPGCHYLSADAPVSRSGCAIRTCPELNAAHAKFCSECSVYPCSRLRQLDQRYSMNHGVSLMGNLAVISHFGITAFLKSEYQRWRCRRCGTLRTMHRPECPACGTMPPTMNQGAHA